MIKVIILRYYNQCSVIKDAFTVIRKVYFKSTICSTGINNFNITHDCSANNALKNTLLYYTTELQLFRGGYVICLPVKSSI